MNIAMLIIGIVLLVFAVFLIVAVLMQQGKSHNLSGAIAGGAETFFGKSKGQTLNKKLSVLTSVIAVIFVVLVCAVYVMQPSSTTAKDYDSFWEMLFDAGEEEAMGTDADDHDADAHEDTTAAAGDKADETTAAAGDKAEETTAAKDTEAKADETTAA